MRALLVLFAFTCLLVTRVHAATPDDVTAVVADFYAHLSAQDQPGVTRYLAPEGFTEVGIGESEPHRLDAQAFAQLFRAGLVIDLHTEEVAAQQFGDTAVVTGVRIGSISPRGASASVSRTPFTMIWTRTEGHWVLRHVHLSALAAPDKAS